LFGLSCTHDQPIKLTYLQFKNNLSIQYSCRFVEINYFYNNLFSNKWLALSSSNEPSEQAKAVQAGAQFWLVKSDEIEPRLEVFRKDYPNFKNRTEKFKVYK
jgi:hypothetical protein